MNLKQRTNTKAIDYFRLRVVAGKVVDLDDVYEKTEKGVEELSTRSYKLEHGLRLVLIFVDGRKTAETLLNEANKLGLDDTALLDLERNGFVRKIQPSAAELMNRIPPTSTSDTSPRSHRYTSPRTISRPEEQSLHFIQAYKLIRETMPTKSGIRGMRFMYKLNRAKNIEDLRKLLDDYHVLLRRRLSAVEAEHWVVQLDELLERSTEGLSGPPP